MAEPSKNAEQTESMEEILQSIKRIMDDNTVGEQKPAEDVFDLTDVVKEGDAAPAQPANTVDTLQAVEAVFSAPPKPAPAPKRAAPQIDDGLMSETSVNAAATAFKQIVDSTQKDYSIPTIPSPALRSGNTVEDLVIEALRPMLKDWLDTNLPVIVQKIVEKEIKRIVSMHND
ncbi:MAG TPA: DUF2497 domain-containing protein [Rickettsiales bacterium]|nr:DUF2497 domain-containing protein [Rickettsiales bacterium]